MASYTGSSTIHDIKKQKDELQPFMASSESVKDLVKGQTLKEPKLAQQGKYCTDALQQCILKENAGLGL
jgi:hypothetical protein